MNRNKKTILIVLGVILLAVAVGVLCIGLRVTPTVNHVLRISELLQPVLDAKNQRMHIAVSAEINGDAFDAESDIFLVSEGESAYLVVQQDGATIYVMDNVLLLENGKAFKIGEKMQIHTKAYEDLLPQIKLLYEVLNITAVETDSKTEYSITVTGEQVDALLAATSLNGTLPVDGIETLNLCLTEKDGTLDQITFSGSAELEGTAVKVHVTLSDFQILASGDCPIPEAVRQSAATVNPDDLFSLTKDLYRLVLALEPFADMESIDGTLGLTVDCGLIQLDTKLKLSDIGTASGEQMDPEKLQALPEALGWLCMEGDISCTETGGSYVYCLVLDKNSMQELSQMILPEMANYAGDLTEGTASIILDGDRVSSMQVSIEGKINALIAKIPISVGVEFFFA